MQRSGRRSRRTASRLRCCTRDSKHVHAAVATTNRGSQRFGSHAPTFALAIRFVGRFLQRYLMQAKFVCVRQHRRLGLSTGRWRAFRIRVASTPMRWCVPHSSLCTLRRSPSPSRGIASTILSQRLSAQCPVGATHRRASLFVVHNGQTCLASPACHSFTVIGELPGFFKIFLIWYLNRN